PARLSLPEMQADLTKKLSKLALMLPQYAGALRLLASRLQDRLGALRPVAPMVVHSDFHIRQLMACGRSVAVLDFDELSQGDPLEDLGHFAADLLGDAIGESTARAAGSALIDAYCALPSVDAEPARIQWHTAFQLLTRAYRSLLQLKPDLETRVARHIELAGELL
ncbi:MAG: phosphotransferase, partial [Bryobacterales bacterium]|nr:phosphotransferase [Bryobacterales bacterium]